MNIPGDAEVIIPGGLTVYRGAIEADDCFGLSQDIDQLWSDIWGEDVIATGVELREIPNQRLGEVRNLFGPVLAQLVDDMGFAGMDDTWFGINNYSPNEIRRGHHDGMGGAVVLNPTDGGEVDIAYVRKRQGPISREWTHHIPINAGDVMVNRLPALYHRGINKTGSTRKNVVIGIPEGAAGDRWSL